VKTLLFVVGGYNITIIIIRTVIYNAQVSKFKLEHQCITTVSLTK